MDSIYRRQRYIYDLTRKYYLLGRDRLIRQLDSPDGGTVIDIGCGTGRNLILAAHRYPDARFFGVDISAEMLVTAEKNVARAGLNERIVFARGDASAFDPGALFGEERFDRIFLSYTLSMIPPWQQVLAYVPDMLTEDGAIHIVDFGQQEKLPGLFRRAFFSWLAKFHVEPRGDLEQVLEGVARQSGLSLEFARLYRGYAWGATLRRP